MEACHQGGILAFPGEGHHTDLVVAWEVASLFAEVASLVVVASCRPSAQLVVAPLSPGLDEGCSAGTLETELSFPPMIYPHLDGSTY